jgi:hypothetical protein
MNIREKISNGESFTVKQKFAIKIITDLIKEIEKQPEYHKRIAAESVLDKGKARIHLSAFDNEILSGAISELMFHISTTTLTCTFSKRNIEGFLSPVFTNIIKIK